MLDRDDAIEVIEEVADIVDGSVKTDYSGRGMNGRTCYGVYTRGDAETVQEEAAERGLKGASVDQLGKGYIVYWPKIVGESEV